MAIVPCPAITSGSSNGMHEHQSALAREFDRVLVGLVVIVAMQHDLAAQVGDRLHLDVGVVSGITMTAGMPRVRAPSATPCA
jgi:hypothetical protein